MSALAIRSHDAYVTGADGLRRPLVGPVGRFHLLVGPSYFLRVDICGLASKADLVINPALSAFPKESALLGHIVVGYGELDISMVTAAGNAMGMTFPLLDALDEVNSERTRIEIVRKLAAPAFDTLGLGRDFEDALISTHECREIRNYFAHCHYGYFHHEDGLLTVKARDLFANGAQKPESLPWPTGCRYFGEDREVLREYQGQMAMAEHDTTQRPEERAFAVRSPGKLAFSSARRRPLRP